MKSSYLEQSSPSLVSRSVLHQPAQQQQQQSSYPMSPALVRGGSPISYHSARNASPPVGLGLTSSYVKQQSPQQLASSPLRSGSPIPQVIIKKEVQMVEDVVRVANLESQLRMSQMQNRCFAAELESLQKKPPMIQEKIQFVEDTRKIDLLNSQFAEVLVELERETQNGMSKDEQNGFLRQRVGQLEQQLRQSEYDNAKVRLQLRDSQEELASFKTSNALLMQQNGVSVGQIDQLNATVSKCIAEISGKNELIEEKNRLIAKHEKSMWELRDIISMQEQSICSKEHEIVHLKEKGEQDLKTIIETSKIVSEEKVVIDGLQISLKSFQDTMSRQEALIHNQAEVIQNQISEIDVLNRKIEVEKSEVDRISTANKCLNAQIELLLKKQDDLVLEIEHLQSHEERLAMLHREIEVEKIAMLAKIKENDRLMSYVANLEKQIKKAHGTSSQSQRSVSPNERSQFHEDSTSRAKQAAIAHADALKNQSLYSSRYSSSEKDQGENMNGQVSNYSTSGFGDFAK